MGMLKVTQAVSTWVFRMLKVKVYWWPSRCVGISAAFEDDSDFNPRILHFHPAVLALRRHWNLHMCYVHLVLQKTWRIHPFDLELGASLLRLRSILLSTTLSRQWTNSVKWGEKCCIFSPSILMIFQSPMGNGSRGHWYQLHWLVSVTALISYLSPKLIYL